MQYVLVFDNCIFLCYTINDFDSKKIIWQKAVCEFLLEYHIRFKNIFK